ncbi:MAG: ferredoxin [Mycobacterium sp.]
MKSSCRIVFDRSKCATIGLCEMAAPDFFSIPDDGEA